MTGYQVLVCITGLALYACDTSLKETDSADKRTVEQLSRAYCGSCHLYPEPGLLPKSSWKKVLPVMGNRLGISTGENDPYQDKSMEEALRLKRAGIYPEEQLLPDSTWKELVTYFLKHAPDSLRPGPVKNHPVNTMFRASFPDVNLGDSPGITMVKFDTLRKKLYLADGRNYLLKLDNEFRVEDFTQLMSPVVELSHHPEQDVITVACIGIMFPNDHQLGIICRLKEKPDFSAPEILISKLSRPVYFEEADLDHNGLSDLIICGFGNALGGLSVFSQQTHGYAETVLSKMPGAVKAYVKDVDLDDDPDLVALFAQGDEGVSIFFNSDGSFTEKKVLRFHPAFGCSDMLFTDINGDSYPDVLLANGDNGDYSNVLKPYHGIRIFINDGLFAFSESYFFPMHGVSRILARDFDLDGDVDIFASSFFPDYKLPEQSLIYLENKGGMKFEATHFPEAKDGRWMVMDAADLDDDGDEDIVVGSFSYLSTGVPEDVRLKWRSSGKHILFLENRSISN